MPELKPFITTVADMRQAQKSYFALIAKAKKSKLPGDWAAAANALKESKALEAKIDVVLPELVNLTVFE